MNKFKVIAAVEGCTVEEYMNKEDKSANYVMVMYQNDNVAMKFTRGSYAMEKIMDLFKYDGNGNFTFDRDALSDSDDATLMLIADNCCEDVYGQEAIDAMLASVNKFSDCENCYTGECGPEGHKR